MEEKLVAKWAEQREMVKESRREPLTVAMKVLDWDGEMVQAMETRRLS